MCPQRPRWAPLPCVTRTDVPETDSPRAGPTQERLLSNGSIETENRRRWETDASEAQSADFPRTDRIRGFMGQLRREV